MFGLPRPSRPRAAAFEINRRRCAKRDNKGTVGYGPTTFTARVTLISDSPFNHAQKTHAIERCPLFAGLSHADLVRIASMSSMQSLDSKEYLFQEGGTVRGLFIVQSGAIKIHRITVKGKEQVIGIFRRDQSFGEETLLSESGYNASASALGATRVVVVRKTDFVPLLKNRPDLVLRMLRSLDRQYLSLVELLDDLMLKDVKTRLAHWLIEHCPTPRSQSPCRIELPVTKNLLALELGTVSETLSRTLAQFRDQQLLSVDGKTLTLLCPSRLGQMFGAGLSEDRFHYRAAGRNMGPRVPSMQARI